MGECGTTTLKLARSPSHQDSYETPLYWTAPSRSVLSSRLHWLSNYRSFNWRKQRLNLRLSANYAPALPLNSTDPCQRTCLFRCMPIFRFPDTEVDLGGGIMLFGLWKLGGIATIMHLNHGLDFSTARTRSTVHPRSMWSHTSKLSGCGTLSRLLKQKRSLASRAKSLLGRREKKTFHSRGFKKNKNLPLFVFLAAEFCILAPSHWNSAQLYKCFVWPSLSFSLSLSFQGPVA